MKPINLSGVLKDFQGKWVAISNDEKHPSVYGSGVTAKEAVNQAESKGDTDFYLMFVRNSDLLYSGVGF